MKILYIANIRLPTEKAHGIQIMKTCEALALAGNDIELVVPTRRNELTANPFTYYGVPENSFKLVTLRVPDLIRYGRFGFLVSSTWFSERIRWGKPFRIADVIYSRDALVLIQYLFLRRKLVFEAHAKPSFIARIVARHAYRVVVISRALREAYVAAGAPPERIVVATDAVDERLFDVVPAKDKAREILGLSLTQHIVVYTGHLYARKGTDTLANAAAQMPKTEFIFVGGTARDIAQFKKQWGDHENIHIIGHVPPGHIPLYLRAADVLVIPNSGKDEDAAHFASPMKLFEYMASGTPIVASNVPSIREILPKDSALFVPPDEGAALARGINALLDNSSRARTFGQAARDLSRRHTWNIRAGIILNGITTSI